MAEEACAFGLSAAQERAIEVLMLADRSIAETLQDCLRRLCAESNAGADARQDGARPVEPVGRASSTTAVSHGCAYRRRAGETSAWVSPELRHAGAAANLRVAAGTAVDHSTSDHDSHRSAVLDPSDDRLDADPDASLDALPRSPTVGPVSFARRPPVVQSVLRGSASGRDSLRISDSPQRSEPAGAINRAVDASSADPVDPVDAKPTHRLSTVFVSSIERDGMALVGYDFDCSWCPHDGIGVLMHGTRVALAGTADIVYTRWMLDHWAKQSAT